MHPDDSPPFGFPNLAEEMWRLRRNLDHVKARLTMQAADPDGELGTFTQMLALKRGSRR